MAFYNAKTIMECTNKVTKYKVNVVDFPTSRENMQILKKKTTKKTTRNEGELWCVSEERRFFMKWNFIKAEQRKSAALSACSTPPGRTWRLPR